MAGGTDRKAGHEAARERVPTTPPRPSTTVTSPAAALLRLQVTAGNLAATTALQRITFRTSHKLLWSREKTDEELTKDERKLRDRESTLKARWRDVQEYADQLKPTSLAAVQDLIDALDSLAVEDWAPRTSELAATKLSDAEKLMAPLVDAVERLRKAADRAKERAAREPAVVEAIAGLQPLLGASEEERDLPFLKPLVDTLDKHDTQIRRLRGATDDVAWLDAARGFLTSVAASGARLSDATTRLKTHREELGERWQSLRRAVDEARADVDELHEVLDEADDLWRDLDLEQSELAQQADTDARDDLVGSRNKAMDALATALEAASEVFRLAKKVLPLHDAAVGAREADLSRMTQSSPEVVGAVVAARKTLKDGRAAVEKVREARREARGLRDEAGKLLKAYRHKRDPMATTQPKARGVASASSAVPDTIEHDGVTYHLIEAGASLYGRLGPGVLAGYPGATELFREALTKGLIASMGSGDTGVKKRSAERYEVKVRRPNLVAHELPGTLRVDNTTAPLRTGRALAVTFDRAFLAHVGGS